MKCGDLLDEICDCRNEEQGEVIRSGWMSWDSKRDLLTRVVGATFDTAQESLRTGLSGIETGTIIQVDE